MLLGSAIGPSKPPVAEQPPAVQRKDWVLNPIDAFVLARLEQAHLSPSPEAEPARLLRRVTLDLTGLPPTPTEVEAFVAETQPGAYERVVDRLLASPRYGERMAWEWLDAARYADTNGYQGDNERTMWPWRNWVIKAYNDNLPYDQFLTAQLAGDLLPNATDEQKIATGFFRNYMINGEGGRIAEENRVEYILDQVETVGTVWLGLTYTCARCHDHKYDPISQRDYYAMFDFFNQTPVDGGGGNPQTPPVMEAPTPEQREQVVQLGQQAEAIRVKRDERATQIEAQREAWEKQMLAGASSNAWTILKPGSAVARYQQLEILDDASVLAKGPNPENDFYDVILPLKSGARDGFAP